MSHALNSETYILDLSLVGEEQLLTSAKRYSRRARATTQPKRSECEVKPIVLIFLHGLGFREYPTFQLMGPYAFNLSKLHRQGDVGAYYHTPLPVG